MPRVTKAQQFKSENESHALAFDRVAAMLWRLTHPQRQP